MNFAAFLKRWTAQTIVILICIFVLIATGCSGTSLASQQDAGVSINQQKPVDQQSTTSGTLIVHYIDVGQADSILVQLPNENILIDAGNNDDGNLVVNYLKQQGVKRLGYVIGTHPHEDHAGGLDVVIKSFEVGKVYLPKVSHTTKTYEDLLLAIKNKGLKVTEAKGGVKLDVDPGVTAELLAPKGTGYDDLNNYSAVLRLTFGNTSFLFTGDAEDVSEAEMLQAGYNLKADVLKVGHHGSSSSTSLAFLKTVSPKYAVISAGKGNKYDHPHSETLTKLAAAGVQVFRTDLMGTIVATSDGENITFNKNTSAVKVQTPDTSISSSTAPVTQSTSTSSGSVEIIGIDLSSEVVTIKNNGNSTVDLSGWRLVSEKGNQAFNFPEKLIVAGATLKIMSGPKAQAAPNTVIWTKKYIWNNDGDPGKLYDANGNMVSQYPR